MTQTHEAQCVITGSYLLYLIDGLLDKHDKNMLTTIRLKQRLNHMVKDKDYIDYVVLSNNAWQDVVEEYADRKMHMVIFQGVETLYYNKFDIMQEFFGESTAATLDRFVMKHTKDGVESALIKETNMICDSLTKAMDKEIFEYIKTIPHEHEHE